MFDHILCPVDFSRHTKEIINYAQEIAKRFSSKLVVLHVIPSLDCYIPYESFILPTSILELEKKIDEEVRKNMENILKEIQIPVKTVIKWGVPHSTILDTVREEKIDLVIMASHGKGSLEQIILGSVAEKVLKRSPCPVLIVRPSTISEDS
ncbi:MAG: universal stress protein [Deltaproteobacteria bacterium]|nr:universal stress protein [Deltaproteobacteria bacterium]